MQSGEQTGEGQIAEEIGRVVVELERSGYICETIEGKNQRFGDWLDVEGERQASPGFWTYITRQMWWPSLN